MSKVLLFSSICIKSILDICKNSLMNTVIQSLQNPQIKYLMQVFEKSKIRKKEGVFVVEGLRELSLAYDGGYEMQTIYLSDAHPELFDAIPFAKHKIIWVASAVFEKLAYRESTSGVIGLGISKSHALTDLKLSKNSLVLVLESIEKPGNIGAVLRTADAAKVDAVILAEPLADLYNPNVIRSSIGCVFTNQITWGSNDEVAAFLKKNNMNVFCATLQNANDYTKEDFTQATALVFGNEAKGLSDFWKNQFQNIIIPMRGFIDSMNISVATAVITFEAIRQRGISV
jgi:RNA methyltransferase, TrmH family